MTPAEEAAALARWQRNKPSLFTDIGLAILFFAVAKLTDITTAAIVGAAAGLALIVVQRFVKVDLLGGLALFGIVLSLVSAGLAIAFQDDWAVKMRTSLMGAITATLFFADAATGARYLAPRMLRYIGDERIVPARLSAGMGLLAFAMAAINWGVVEIATDDQWLFYTTFGDFVLAMAGFFLVLRFARR
jgi:intracellular septation protein A